MMAEVTIYYQLSKKGQKADLITGGDGRHRKAVTIAHGEPHFADAVELASVGHDGKATIDYASSVVSNLDDLPAYDEPPSVGQLIADVRRCREQYAARKQAEEAERQAELDRRVQEVISQPAEKLIELYSPYQGFTLDWPLKHEHLVEEYNLYELRDKAQAICDERNAERKRQKQEQEQEKEAAQAAAEQEKRDWIKSYGSERLQRLLAEEIECEAAYRDERIAQERFGWRYSDRVPGTYDDPRNPPEEALKLLDRARKYDQAAKLVYWTIPHSCDDDCCLDFDCPTYEYTGYAAVAEFLGREIVLGGPDD